MITETWLSPEDSVIMGELTPSGYHLQTFHRQNRPGGGIELVHKANLKVQTVQSGEQSSFEATVTSESNSIRLLLVYRIPYSANHPVSSSVFFEEFAAYLETTLLIPDRLLIAGDLNFRIDCVEDRDASSFCDMLESMGLQQHVSGPTHRAGHTLDLLITRNCDDPLVSNVRTDSWLSDHVTVLCNLHLKEPDSCFVERTFRIIKNISVRDFHDDLVHGLKKMIQTV